MIGVCRPSQTVCLSDVAYIGSNSKTKRPRKTKLCKGVPQVTCDSHTDFKVKRSKVKVTGRGYIVAATYSRTACLHCGFRSIRPISEATIFRIFINQVAADGLKQHQCASATMPPVSVSGSYSSTAPSTVLASQNDWAAAP